jgi:hypothetical protein
LVNDSGGSGNVGALTITVCDFAASSIPCRIWFSREVTNDTTSSWTVRPQPPSWRYPSLVSRSLHSRTDADRIELADLRTPQRSQQIAKVARVDLDRPIAGWRTQVCREVCLQMERREAATQQQPKRLAVTGPASFGELNGVEKFQWTLPETNAALKSETVDGMSPEVAAKTCSMSEYRRSMASVVLNVGLPPGISSDECNMNSI